MYVRKPGFCRSQTLDGIMIDIFLSLATGAMMMTAIHIISNGLTIIGFVIMWKGWSLIHGAKGGLVTEGPHM